MPTGSSKLLEVLRKRVQTLLSEGRIGDALRVAQTATDSARRQMEDGTGGVPDLVSWLFVLADLRQTLDDREGAERVYLEGLGLAGILAGEDGQALPDLDVARLQAGLASLYDFSAREGDALPLYLEAIAILERHGPGEILEAAYLQNNVAMILKNRGDHEEAEARYGAALATFTEALGDQHPTVATVLNNLGGLYTFMSRPADAEAMHQRALQIRKQAEGRTTPDQAQSLCNLAAVFHREGEFDRALRYYEQARRLFEADLEGVEKDYAIAMRNFAVLLREQGNEPGAREIEDAARARLDGAHWEE